MEMNKAGFLDSKKKKKKNEVKEVGMTMEENMGVHKRVLVQALLE